MNRLFFKRQQRLLNSADFTHVFNHVDVKISHNAYLILANRQQPPDQSRLGLIVAKKNIRSAVDRNTFKRIARESFRHHQSSLQGINLIVMARSGAVHLDTTQLRLALDQAWPKLCKRLQQPRPESPTTGPK